MIWILLTLSFTPMTLASETPQPVQSVQPQKAKKIRNAKKLKEGKVREKEAEGSQAPNRFEMDPVIKSKYQSNGVPLEVDPD